MHQQILDVKQPVAQFIINSFLQAAAFAVATAFGVFAVKSVDVAILANKYTLQSQEQAMTANQLALLAFCVTVNGNNVCKAR